ncbi:mandelate racemase/muconate lactonizing enzyme family protein [Ruania suaedae]|uniref:enolase C-terminal domain-like protein n=1 Tax=Ruania suaedae TaxID=2897774 RepID=UPI001E40C4E7|nr:enolase C-terminal domain-like protein [Ruania suaedae]UFU02860.1 mandelate racemase/muconate lactonizing enzyme family protein [Ruania suaedae]
MTEIESVTPYVLRLPRAGTTVDPAGPRYRRSSTRSVYPATDETLLVRVVADGVVAWGECLSPVVPEAPAAVITHLLGPLIVGQEVSGVRPMTALLQSVMRERGHREGHHADAVAAVDLALWDLEGKLLGVPVHRLLGGATRNEVPVYLTDLPAGDARPEAAAAAVESGLSRLKLHLVDDVPATIDAYDQVASALGSAATSVRLAVDAHWRHDRAQAVLLGRELAARGAWFLEAPTAPEDHRGHAMVGASGITVAAGEAMRSRFDFSNWARVEALGIAQPDVGRCGISELDAIARVMEASHVGFAPHHSMATGLAYAAALHLCAAHPNLVAMEYSPAVARRSRDLVRAPFLEEPPTDGTLQVPYGPGLGVEVDEATVAMLST